MAEKNDLNFRSAIKIRGVSDLLIALYVFLLPYDNFPLPISGTSKPISVLLLIPLSMYILLLVTRVKSIKIHSGWLLLFALYSTLWTLANAFIFNEFLMKGLTSYGMSLKGLIPLYMYILGFYVVYEYASRRKGNHVKLISWALLSLSIPIFFSILQIIATYFKIDILLGFLGNVGLFFTERSSEVFSMEGRLRLLTLEPSWAAQQLILYFVPVFFLASYYFSWKRGGNFLSFGLIISLMMATGSGLVLLWGFAVVFLVIMVVLGKFLFKARVNKQILLATPVFILVVGFGVIFGGGKFDYQLKKIETLSEVGLESEASTATRLMLPYIGLKVFIGEAPVTGVGLSMFGFYFSEYSPNWYSQLPEGRGFSDPESTYFASTRNLFVRLLAETGIIGFTLYLLFLIRVYPWGKLDQKMRNCALLWFLSLVLCYMNFDSFSNLYIPFILAVFAVNKSGRYQLDRNTS